MTAMPVAGEYPTENWNSPRFNWLHLQDQSI